MASGVGKSGSPAPNPMTLSPWAWRALALASTARVAEGDTAAIRAEIRLPVVPAPRGVVLPVSVCWAMSAMIPYVTDSPDIRIPANLLPGDGRFGAGPSKVRPESVEALAAVSRTYLGTSHRQRTVKSVVGSLRAGLSSLFSLPEGYEVVLGNGGTTCFWDAATFGLIEHKSQHLSFGEFSSKFATAAAQAPHLGDPEVITSEVGTHPLPVARDDVDLYALTHNETSTGVMMPIRRPEGATSPADGGGLVAVDATSGAGGLAVDPAEFDAYYFAPQKCFGSDGGLWVALLSPAAVERIGSIAATGRWVPASMDLTIALDNSRLDQTYNTPALATIFLFDDQVRWFNEQGGLDSRRPQ